MDRSHSYHSKIFQVSQWLPLTNWAAQLMVAFGRYQFLLRILCGSHELSFRVVVILQWLNIQFLSSGNQTWTFPKTEFLMENNIYKLKIFHCHVTRGYPLFSFCAPVEWFNAKTAGNIHERFFFGIGKLHAWNIATFWSWLVCVSLFRKKLPVIKHGSGGKTTPASRVSQKANPFLVTPS